MTGKPITPENKDEWIKLLQRELTVANMVPLTVMPSSEYIVLLETFLATIQYKDQSNN